MLDILVFGLVMVLGFAVLMGIIGIVLITTIVEQYRKIIAEIKERRRYNLYR